MKSFESFSQEHFKEAVLKELSSTKKFLVSHIPSIIGIAMNKSGSKTLTDSMVQDFKEVVDEYVFGGIEPEDYPENWYKFWDALKSASFLYATEDQRRDISKNIGRFGMFGGSTPYRDKSLPYMSWSVEMKELLDGPYSDVRNMMLYVEYI